MNVVGVGCKTLRTVSFQCFEVTDYNHIEETVKRNTIKNSKPQTPSGKRERVNFSWLK